MNFYKFSSPSHANLINAVRCYVIAKYCTVILKIILPPYKTPFMKVSYRRTDTYESRDFVHNLRTRDKALLRNISQAHIQRT